MIVTIEDSRSSASIDSLGAQLISFQSKASGKEYIWQRDPSFWANCSPLLFPAVGNSRNDQTCFDGTAYPMPRHGFCKQTDFSVSSQEPHRVSFTITDSEQTRTMYPYAFRLTVTYTLDQGALSMDVTVANTDQRLLPYCIGTHPGFQCPMEEGSFFEDYRLLFQFPETLSSIRYDQERGEFDRTQIIPQMKDSDTLPLTYALFDHDAVYFETLKSRRVSLVHKETGKGIEVQFPDYESVAFWTAVGKQAPFLCIEPWNGSAICSDEDDDFFHKHHLQTLDPSDSRTYHLGIRIIE